MPSIGSCATAAVSRFPLRFSLDGVARAFVARASLAASMLVGFAMAGIAPNSHADVQMIPGHPSFIMPLETSPFNFCYKGFGVGNDIWGLPCFASEFPQVVCTKASNDFAAGGDPSLLQQPGTLINPQGESPNRTYTCRWVYAGFTSNHPVVEKPGAPPQCPKDSLAIKNEIGQIVRCVCRPGMLEHPLNLEEPCVMGKGTGAPPCCVGDPVNPANGNKFELQVVYRGRNGFGMILAYNTGDPQARGFGPGWRNSFDRRVLPTSSGVVVLRGDGRGIPFTLSATAGTWDADPERAERLVELKSGGARTGWLFTSLDSDEVETFDAGGSLLTITSRAGLTQTMQYSDGSGGANGGFVLDDTGTPTTTPLPAGLLIKATDGFGRTLLFGYNSTPLVTRLTEPAGGVYLFAYDASANLASITFPGGAVRSYIYDEPANTGGAALDRALTGITDENGARFATWKYDSQQRAVSSENAGGADLTTLTYAADGSATVTDALGNARTYGFQSIFDAPKNTGITGPACPTCGSAAQTLDTNGNVASRTDWNGNRTDYSYDLTRNLETQRTEGVTSSGASTPQTRMISTQWHPTWRLATTIAEPLRITTNSYDADGTACGAKGALCSRTVQATSDAGGAQGFSATAVGSPRTWTYTYNANGSVLTVDGPRTDVSDVTIYTYYPNDDADAGKRGNVATITNAAGHITQITSYNAHGQPLTIVDPNGLTTTLAYDARQRLTSRTVGSEVTSYEYDAVGQLKKVTLPDTSYLSYAYDDAHRLIVIQDNLGNRISYTLDVMGNRTQEQVFDPASALAQTRSRVYDSLNRLFKDIGAVATEVTQYAYDDQGNVTSVTNPLSKVTSNQYDALNRLKQVTQPGSVVTQYAYNGLDALSQVTDPRGLATSYTVDGLGNLTLQSSPDTGNTSNIYDAAGNLLTQSDAKSQVTAYAYDALNRVTLITFQDGSKHAYAYDQGTNGIGRLSSITETDPSSAQTSLIQFGYDLHGRVTSETRTVAGKPYVVGYSYDSAGRLSGMTYPSGRTMAYDFDALGRVNQVTTTKDNHSAVLVQNVQYQPFGGVKGFTLGNGQVYSRSIDQDGRIASYTLGSTTYALTFDDASRITGIGANTYGYDDLDRLTSAVLASNTFGYSYDGMGNRLSKSVGSNTDIYTYSSTSNQLATLSPASAPPRTFTFDPNGSTTNDGVNTYAYDTRGRMVQATSAVGMTSYQVNALGQRVRKTNGSGDTLFHYDTKGRLIAETDPGGTLKREYFYLGDIPVAVLQ